MEASGVEPEGRRLGIPDPDHPAPQMSARIRSRRPARLAASSLTLPRRASVTRQAAV